MGGFSLGDENVDPNVFLFSFHSNMSKYFNDITLGWAAMCIMIISGACLICGSLGNEEDESGRTWDNAPYAPGQPMGYSSSRAEYCWDIFRLNLLAPFLIPVKCATNDLGLNLQSFLRNNPYQREAHLSCINNIYTFLDEFSLIFVSLALAFLPLGVHFYTSFLFFSSIIEFSCYERVKRKIYKDKYPFEWKYKFKIEIFTKTGNYFRD